jgi:hypothetical protein
MKNNDPAGAKSGDYTHSGSADLQPVRSRNLPPHETNKHQDAEASAAATPNLSRYQQKRAATNTPTLLDAAVTT